MVPNARTWRLEQVPLVSPRGLAGVVLLLVAFAAVFGPTVAAAVRAIAQGAAPTEPTVTRELLYLNLAFSALALALLPCLYLLAVRPGVKLVHELGLRWTARTPLFVLLAVAFTIGALLLLGGALWALSETGVYEEEPSRIIAQLDKILWWDLVILLPVASALTEEAFFRGFLQPRIGLVASSLLFGVAHLAYGTVLQIVVPILLGLLFGFLYRWSRTLWAPVAAHFTFNLVQLVVLYVGP